MNTKMKYNKVQSLFRVVLCLALCVESLPGFSQLFFLTDDHKPVVRHLQQPRMPTDWTDLTIDDAEQLLVSQGFDTGIKHRRDGDMEMILGGKLLEAVGSSWRALKFKDGLIVGYWDKVEFLINQERYMNSALRPMLSSRALGETARKSIQENEDRDGEVEQLFLNEWNSRLLSIIGFNDSPTFKSVPASGGGYDLLTDNGRYSQFSYLSNSILRRGIILQRACQLTSNFRFTSGDLPYTKFELWEYYNIQPVTYLIEDINLKEVDTYDLLQMVEVFISDCRTNGIQLPPNVSSNIQTKFASLDPGTLALSFGMGNDSEINIVVDPKSWASASQPSKWYVMYHELGHDVLNLEHGDCGKMMFPFADKGYSWDEFWEDKESMFKNYLERN